MKLSMKPSMKPRSEKDELSSMPLFNWDDVMIPLIELAVRFNGKTLPKQVVPPLPAKTARKVMRMLTVSGTGCKSPVVDGNAFLTLLCSEASLPASTSKLERASSVPSMLLSGRYPKAAVWAAYVVQCMRGGNVALHRLLHTAIEMTDTVSADTFVCGLLDCKPLLQALRERLKSLLCPIALIRLPMARVNGPLLCAVAAGGCLRALRHLLDDLRTYEVDGTSVLTEALIAKNYLGRTPLMCAVAGCNVQCVKELLGEVIKLSDGDMTRAVFSDDKSGRNILHLACQPTRDVTVRDIAETVEAVSKTEKLKDLVPDLTSSRSKLLRQTPLMLAALLKDEEDGSTPVLDCLLDLSSDQRS